MIIENTGRLPYRQAWRRQLSLADDILNGTVEEHILLVEHEHVYTLGVHGHADNMLLTENMLSQRGIECIRTERGGDITYHGPGQITVYILLNLRNRKMGVKNFVHALEEAVILTLQHYAIKGHRIEGATGVWLEPGTPRERKICAIGVKVKHGVTYHGLALNVNTDLSFFSYINPCGFIDKGVTSIANELGQYVDFEEAKKVLAANLVSEFR